MPQGWPGAAGAPLRLSVSARADAVLVTAEGVVDASNADFLLATMTGAATPGADVLLSHHAEAARDRTGLLAVLDLSGVRLIDNAGLSAVVTAQRHAARAGVTWRLAGPTEPVLALLEAAGLHDEALTVHSDADSAVKAEADG